MPRSPEGEPRAGSRRRFWILLLLVVSVCWGASFTVIHAAVAHVDPHAFVTLRFLVAASLTMAIGGRRMLRAMSWATIRDGGWLGLLLAAGHLLQTAGLARTSPSNSAFLTGISVVLVPVLLSIGGWRLRRTSWMAVLLAAVALGILTLDPRTLSVNLGDVLSVGCAIAYAAQIVQTSRCTTRHDLWALTFVEFVVIALISGGAWAAHGAPTDGLALPGVWGALGFSAVLCTVFAYVVMNAAQRVVSAWEAGLVFTTEPLFATVIAVSAGAEAWSPRMAIGGLLILVAMVIAETAQRAAAEMAPESAPPEGVRKEGLQVSVR